MVLLPNASCLLPVVTETERVARGLGNLRILVIGEAPDLLLHGGIAYGSEHGQHGGNVFTPVEGLLQQRFSFFSALNQHHPGDGTNLFVVRSERAHERSAGGANARSPPDR